MHAYSKRFLQVVLVGIQKATYLVDECLSKLESFAGKDFENSRISLIGSNTHKNRIKVKIEAKNKQTEVEWREKGHSRAYTRDWRALEGALRATFYTRVSMHSRGLAAGSLGLDSGRPGCTRVMRFSSPRLPRVACRSCRAPPYADRCVAAMPPLSSYVFLNFPETWVLAFSIHFLSIFISSNP